MNRQDRVIRGAAAVVVVIVLAVAGYLTHAFLTSRDLDAAVRTAIAQYDPPVGVGAMQRFDAVGWPDCAVVELYNPDSDFRAFVATIKEDGHWQLGAANSNTMSFDFADVGTRTRCLEIARSGNGR